MQTIRSGSKYHSLAKERNNEAEIATYQADTPEDEGHIFYNGTIYNNTDHKILARISETRSSPLLDNPSKYNLAVARMSVSSDALPIFKYRNSIYYVSLVFGSAVYTASLDGYMAGVEYVYNFYRFLESINDAMQDLNFLLAGAHPSLNNPKQPYMIFDAPSGLFTLLIDPKYITADPNIAVRVYFSYPLFARFTSFWAEILSYDSINHLDVRFYFPVNPNNILTLVDPDATPPVPTTPMVYYANQQQNNALGHMFDYQALVLTSGSLPVAAESISITGALTSSDTKGASASLPVITDFVLPVVASGVAAQNFTYLPAIYRLIPMNGTTPLNRIDCMLYIQSKTGVIEEFYIPPGQYFNIKLLFIKRGLSN